MAKKPTQPPQAVKSPEAVTLRRTAKGGQLTAAAAKAEFLKILRNGHTVEDACKHVGRHSRTYKYWRASDEDFKASADHILGMRRRKPSGEAGGTGHKPVPDFPEFCEEYLGMRLFWHQLQWYDVLEGREPRDLHPAQHFAWGADRNMLLWNVPPGHAKSTTITAAYTLWRMLRNPNDSHVIVSASEMMAKKWLFQIKDWLTSRTYSRLQADFGPEGGFEKTSPRWSATQIYFGSELRDENAKDPNLEVLGMGGTIYGARASLIILDDIVQTSNAHEFDKQIEWLTGMVTTRLSDEDQLLVVGTRVAPVDLYRELLDPKRYEEEGGVTPWSVFRSPAVLEYADDPADWLTLWPKSNVTKRGQAAKPDEDGLYPKWDGPSLARMRRRLATNPRAWTLNYQQEEVDEDSTFPREQVYGCVDNRRNIGSLEPYMAEQGFGTPKGGMAGLKVIAGLDPASAGHTAAVVVAFDPDTGKRWMLDAFNKAGATPQQIRELMIGWVERYGVQEWRVEKVLLHQWIMQDQDISRALSTRGCILADHITNYQTKWDADGGVLSLTALVVGGDRDPKTNLLQIPTTKKEAVRELCDQMVTWFPKTKGKTDLLMALWFCESRIRQFVRADEEEHWMDTPFRRGMDKEHQVVVDLSDPDAEDLDMATFSPWSRRKSFYGH